MQNKQKFEILLQALQDIADAGLFNLPEYFAGEGIDSDGLEDLYSFDDNEAPAHDTSLLAFLVPGETVFVGDADAIKAMVETHIKGRIDEMADAEEDEDTTAQDEEDLLSTLGRVKSAVDDIAGGKESSYSFDLSTDSWDSDIVLTVSCVRGVRYE